MTKIHPYHNGTDGQDCGGELGIRTPDSFHYASFQDWCIQPLYQLSIFSFCLATIYSICDTAIKIKCFYKISQFIFCGHNFKKKAPKNSGLFLIVYKCIKHNFSNICK